jgi:hypothetical protein
MADQELVRTELGIDVLNDQAIVFALSTTHHIRDDQLSPNTFGPLKTSGQAAQLNAAVPLSVAIGVWNKLGAAIHELARRQGVTL